MWVPDLLYNRYELLEYISPPPRISIFHSFSIIILDSEQSAEYINLTICKFDEKFIMQKIYNLKKLYLIKNLS